MKSYDIALLNKIADYDFDFRNHDSDNSGLYYFDEDNIDEFWKWCEENNLFLLGFCKVPKYRSERGVGLMFENIVSFEKYWFHVPPESYCSVVRALFGQDELAKIWL